MIDLFSATVVLTRIFALYMLANATFSIPTALALITEAREQRLRFSSDTTIFGATAIVYLIVALILFIYAKKFARFVIRGLENTNIELLEANYSLLQAAAFSTLGAYLLAYAIPNLAKIVTIYVSADNPDNPGLSHSLWPDYGRIVTVEYLVEAIVQVALGVWLLIGSRGIVKVISKGWDSIKAE